MTFLRGGGCRISGLVLAGCLLALPGSASAQQDDNARLNARAALAFARLVYLKNGSFAEVTPKALKQDNPDLRIVDDGPSTGSSVLSVKVVSPTHLRIAVYGDKTCWGVREQGSGTEVPTGYAKKPGPAAECRATAFKDHEFHEQDQAWR